MNRELNTKLEEIKGALDEARTVDPSKLSQIKKLTAANHHVAAIKVGAEALGLKELAKKVAAFEALLKFESGIPGTLTKYRDGLYDGLMTYAKRYLGDDEFKKFYAAF